MSSYNLTQLLANIQYSMADKVTKHDCFNEVNVLTGVDVSFAVDNEAVAAAVVMKAEGLEVVEKNQECEVIFPLHTRVSRCSRGRCCYFCC